MSQELRLEYLNAIRELRRNSGRSKKSLILDEFSSVCGCSRKYGITILAGISSTIKRWFITSLGFGGKRAC